MRAALQRAVIGCFAALIASTTVAASAAGQRPYRSGFWAEAGFDQARLLYACAGCAVVTHSSPAGAYLRVGGAVSMSVVVGVEASSNIYDSSKTENPVQEDPFVAENALLAGIVLWYPSRSGFFVKGGIGVADGQITFGVPNGGETVAEGTGVGFTYGLGWDWPIGRSFALSINLTSRIAAIGDLVFPSGLIDDAIVTTYAFGIGVALR